MCDERSYALYDNAVQYMGIGSHFAKTEPSTHEDIMSGRSLPLVSGKQHLEGKETMSKKTQERSFRVAPLLGAGVLSASLLKSSFDRVTQARDSVVKNAKNAMPDQLPATMLSQLQLDHLAQAIADRAADFSGQMQGVAGRFTGKSKPQPNYRAWWIAGIGLGFAAAGATAYVITRRRMHQQAAQELVALPTPMTNNGHHSPQQRLRGVVSNIMRRDAGDQPATSAAVGTANTATMTTTEFEVADPSQAQFIGNIRTMIYHPSDSDHLPSEDNRIYFRSEDDAQAAGYHKAENE